MLLSLLLLVCCNCNELWYYVEFLQFLQHDQLLTLVFGSMLKSQKVANPNGTLANGKHFCRRWIDRLQKQHSNSECNFPTPIQHLMSVQNKRKFAWKTVVPLQNPSMTRNYVARKTNHGRRLRTIIRPNKTLRLNRKQTQHKHTWSMVLGSSMLLLLLSISCDSINGILPRVYHCNYFSLSNIKCNLMLFYHWFNAIHCVAMSDQITWVT